MIRRVDMADDTDTTRPGETAAIAGRPVTGPTCHGRGATEHCAKAAKYLVGKSPTCGVHMPQLVKLYLRSEPDLAVKVCLIARGGR